jgi:serine/threonine-protein kinase
MTDSQPPPVSGLVAGKYEVVRLIGRGGMGSVWEGRHASLGTRVAIKFIDQEYAESQEARSRFVTEARAAATIQSKHAIQIFDHGVTDDGRPYMVMELLVGEPLDRRIDRLGRISLPDTARVLSQVCRALQRAHDAGIIHRDLKPENIFLVRSLDDDDEIAKVLDFGIAKIKAPPGEKGLTSSTKTGAVLGTPYYMSPEQARGLRTMDYRTDLWSLGVIAYKCVTGVLPFEGESVGDLLVKICTAPPPTPSLTMPGLPATFDAWFLRALEREPLHRYNSASELADALAFAAGVSVRRGLSSQSDPGRNFTAMSPRALDVSPAPYASTPAGLPGVDALTPPTAAGITSAPFTASASSQRPSRGVLVAVVAAGLIGGSVGVAAVMKLASATKPAAHSAAAGQVAPTNAAPSANTKVNAAGVLPPTASPAALPSMAPLATVTSSASMAVLAPSPARTPAKERGKGAPGAGTTFVAPSKPPAAVNPQPTSADPGY